MPGYPLTLCQSKTYKAIPVFRNKIGLLPFKFSSKVTCGIRQQRKGRKLVKMYNVSRQKNDDIFA